MSTPAISRPRARLLLGVALVLLATSAQARVLCASPLGSVRWRSSCLGHETAVDVPKLLGRTADAVPVRNWVPAEPKAPAGLESVAAAADATMINLDPCRLIDTRPGTTSELVGDDVGALADHEIRTYTLTGSCAVPTDATALSINLAIVPGVESGFASVGPTGSIAAFPPGPGFASLNYDGGGLPLSNSLVVPLDDQGRIDVYVARSADVIIDTNGFFLPKDTGTNAWFVPGTGTAAENGTALAAAVVEINALSGTTPAVLELGPGEFDLGTTGISIDQPTTLFGAGAHATTITCECTSGQTVLLTLDASAVHDIHVENTDTEISADALLINHADDVVVRRARFTTAGGDGIAVVSSTGVVIEHVDITADHTTVFASVSSEVTIRDCSLVSTIFDVIQSSASTFTVDSTTLETEHAARAALQIFSSGDATFRHSRLVTAGDSYVKGSTGTISLSQCFVDAGTLSFTGTETCTATSGPGTFDATTCP